ncbi:hypothetical protein EJ02DRAFT_126722 [Clathrospora elynae]|uniref:Uncharacterized protein n=1 Tax=Clathrospora elynae TaxID=706981 RepID=A0A6A5SVD7_9PLEO|nr:hypothetical protein EJ02DRAFT_126722 [Clathrospora elynae]
MAAGSLLIGLIAGLFLALLLQQVVVPTIRLPDHNSSTEAAKPPLPLSELIAHMVKNALRAASRYKSAVSLQHLAPPLLLTSPNYTSSSKASFSITQYTMSNS